MPAYGARWLDQTVAPLPGAQGHRVDACEPRDFPDRIQALLFRAIGR